MDSLPGPFTIEINGQPISKLNGPLQTSNAGYFRGQHAQTGPEPAVFQLREHRLISDGHILTRDMVEDMSLMPKRVFWFEAQNHQTHHRVQAENKGNGYSLTMSGSTLAVRDGAIYADIINQQPETVVVKMLA
ncbi:hypothetical protein ACET3X_007345 [Alternaria dauci]|uniref:Uncharacterized protein n=1 Tax=Alternaria dauci TaxID=48095 RepID=A0ABR3UE77_9PLEO